MTSIGGLVANDDWLGPGPGIIELSYKVSVHSTI